MTGLREILSVVLMVSGAAFMLLGSVGLLRLPDFFTRTHAVSKVDTLGIMLLLGGLAVHEGATLSALKLVLIIAFVAAVSPVAAHALARAATSSGLRAWRCPGTDTAARSEEEEKP